VTTNRCCALGDWPESPAGGGGGGGGGGGAGALDGEGVARLGAGGALLGGGLAVVVAWGVTLVVCSVSARHQDSRNHDGG